MWPAFRNSMIFDTWRRHFRMRIITPPHPFMDTTRHYLCAQFPHATFPMACWLNPPLVGAAGSGTIFCPDILSSFSAVVCRGMFFLALGSALVT
jgi:hypothetical protein